MAQAPRPLTAIATLASAVLLAALIPTLASAVTRAGAAASVARRGAPKLLDARMLPSLDAGGRPALSYSPVVSLSDTFLLAGFGFQNLAGACQTRDWAGEDRVASVFAHPDPNHVVNQSFFAGQTGSSDSENMTGFISTTALVLPRAVAVDDSGNVIFSDEGFGRQRLFMASFRTGAMDVYGEYPGEAGSAGPYSAAFDPAQRNVVASDFNQGTLLRFPGNGEPPTTLAGFGALTQDTSVALANIGTPAQVAVASGGDIYFADPSTHRVRVLRSGQIVTVAGTGSPGAGDPGPATGSPLNGPTGVALDQGRSLLYIADTGNNRIVTVDLGTSLVIATTPVPQPGALAFDPTSGEILHSTPPLLLPGSLFIASGNRILQLDLVSFELSTVVGGGDGYGLPSDAALGHQQTLIAPTGLTSDGLNGVYFADPGSSLLLHLDADSRVSAVAGIPVSISMGEQALWFGADAASAPDEVRNWVQPSGFGNDWSQRLTSPEFSLGLHPGSVLTFDAALDMESVPGLGPAVDGRFVAVQGLRSDGTWTTLGARLHGPGAPAAALQAFTGSGIVQVSVDLAADGNDLAGLAATTRLRVVVQTGESGSNEDGFAVSTHGAVSVDNIGVSDQAETVIPTVDFESGLTTPYSLSAMNGITEVLPCYSPGSAARPAGVAVNPCEPYTRDVPAPATTVELRSAFDPQDPTCAWTFLSAGDSVASGLHARLTSPWFAMAPGDTELLISFSGKLNTTDQARFVRVFVRGKRAGDAHPRFTSWSLALLNSGTTGGDEASPYLNQRVLNYPADFFAPQAAESLQIVFQVEDRGESTDPVYSLDGRPRTRLPYLDDIRLYQLHVDRDHDGVADAYDACPDVCAAGQDGDGDGCPDATATLRHVESWSRDQLPIHYTISQGADPANSTPNDLSEIQAGMNAWTAVASCTLQVVRDPDVPRADASPLDGVNLVTFQDPDFQFPNGVLAVTPTFSFTRRAVFDDQVVLPGQIVDADMIFNPASHFSTPGFTPAGTSYDLRSVATHEAGHLFGLSHSGVLNSTMFFVIQNGIGTASLAADDSAAIGAAYPAPLFSSSLGTITGRVTRGVSDDSIPGALVTAVRLGGEGVLPDSVASDYTDEHGRYALRGLAPGDYGVRLTPLDGEVGGYPLTPDFISERVASGAQTNFSAEWYGGPESASDDPGVIASIGVGAGALVTGIDILSNIDITPPFVTASSPAIDESGVRQDATVLARFSERIDPGTLQGAFRIHLQDSTTSLGGSALIINGDRTVIFNPQPPLLLNRTYVLDVTSGVRDRQGVPLDPPYSATFNTLASVALAISDIEPRAAAAGSYITVLGGGFDTAGGDSVEFSACSECVPSRVPALSVTPSALVVRVPSNAVTGPLRAIVHENTSNPFIQFRRLDPALQAAPSRVADIALNFAPTDVAVSPGGGVAYAVGAGGLAIIDLATRVPSYKAIGASSHIGLTPDGRRALITQPALGQVLDVDADPASLTPGAIKATIRVGDPGAPDGVALSTSGRRGYVTDQISGTIYVIDTDASSATRDSLVGELADTVAVLTGGVTVLPTDDQVLYTSGNAGSRAKEVGSLAVSVLHPGASGGGVAATPSASEALYTGTGAFGGDLLSVLLSGGDPGATSSLVLGGNLRDVIVAPQGQSALVVNSGTNMLQVVGVDPGDSPSYHAVAAQVGTGSSPVAVAQDEDGGVIAVANFGSRTVGIYRTGGSAGLVRAVPGVARPGDRVAVQSSGNLFGAGSQVDLGGGPFPVSYRTPDNAGGAFVVPAGPQRQAALSALDPAGTRTLALPFRVVDPIPSPTAKATGFGLDLAALACPDNSVGVFDAMRLSADGSLLALVRTPVVCPGSLEFYAADDERPREFGQVLSRGPVVPAGERINDMAFTPDGLGLWAVNGNLDVRIMNSDRSSPGFGSLISSFGFSSGGGPGGIAVDPLGRYMCVGSFAGESLRIFTPAGALVRTIAVQGASEAVAASPDGRTLVAAGGGRARFVDLETLTAIGVSALHGATTPGLLRLGLAVSSNGRRAVVRFSNGIGVYNLDPSAGAVGSELYFGNPFLASGATPTQLVAGPGGFDVLAGSANRDSLIRIDAGVIPPVVTFAAIGQRANLLAASLDGRELWIGRSSGTASGDVKLLNLGRATGLALVAGAGQSALAGATLPLPVVVRATGVSGDPETGVVVRFTLLSGDGSLDHDSTTVYHPTDANGEARVEWTLPATLGPQDLAITALGVAGGSLQVTAQVVQDDSQIPPAVLAFGPPDGSSDFSVGTPVFIRFNQKMDSVTTVSRMKLFAGGVPVAGSFRFEQGGSFVLFQPTQPLAFGARCSLSVVPGALDRDGQALAAGGYSVFHMQSAPPLAVTTLSPPAAAAGASIVLAGTGFSAIPAANTVLFNLVPTTVTAASPTSLTAPVPPGAVSGPVTVQVGSSLSPGVNFTVLQPAPPITLVSDSLPAGPTATRVVITSDATRCYVTNPSTNSVTAIDLATLKTLAVITVGLDPSGIDLLPDNTRAYVCNQNSDDVSVIDITPGSPTYHQVIRTIPVGHQPQDLAVSAFGPAVLVVEYGSATLSVIDANSGNATFDEIVSTTNTGVGGRGIAITPDGGRAYICTAAGTVVRFDLKTGAVVTSTNTGVGGHSISITPDGGLAIVLLENGQLVAINILPGTNRENQIVTTTNTGVGGGGGVLISPDGGSAYVTGTDGNVVFVFKIVSSSGQPLMQAPGSAVQFVKVDSVRVGLAPVGMAFDPQHGRFGLVANSGSGTITVIGTLGNEPPPVTVAFKFEPSTLNLKSMGRWVSGSIEPPAPFDAHDIDIASLRLNGVVPVDPQAPVSYGGDDPDDANVLKVKFLRSAVELVVAEGDSVPVTITGKIGTRNLIGTDIIRVKRGKVQAPAAGDVLQVGQPYTIRWMTPAGVKPKWVAVLHSMDRGATWILDGTHLSNSGTWSWPTPWISSDSAKVAVVLVESSDSTGTLVTGVLGVSDYFRISGVTAVEAAPLELSFAPIRPNPADGRARMRYGLPRAADVRLEIYDLQGRRVRTLARGPEAAGWYDVTWTGRVDGGTARAGVYFVRFQAEGREFKQRLVWLK